MRGEQMIEDLRAIMVCVDFWDLAAITIPRNEHHFREMHFVISEEDVKTAVEVLNAIHPKRRPTAFFLHVTDLFYADGAVMNKWRALEWALDRMGRDGWLCIMDADVIWPQKIEWPGELVPGFLCSPLRRMVSDVEMSTFKYGTLDKLTEDRWKMLPIHRNVNEWAGYSQIFSADDPVLGPPPWHEITYRHAGASDSWFQAKWPRERKIRPNWECLHLGPAGENWFGRTSPRLDGSLPEGREEKLAMTRVMWERRAIRRRSGLDPFAEEKIEVT
jgi:hypothetical protein